MSLVEVRGLTVRYGRAGDPRARVAVRGVDLDIAAGEKVAVVGESGSGKTTTANALIGLLPRAATITGGTVLVGGVDVVGGSQRSLRGLRGRTVGLIPQDPMVALNPTMRIGEQVAEAVRRRGDVPSRSVPAEVVEALEKAGLDDGVLRSRQYPHELSGGMRQRVLIAIAIAAAPQLIIADEPTSALDVTTQRRILDHLDGLVRDTGTALLVITHDLGVAADRADRVLVMSDGEVVESGTPGEVLVDPAHAYTRRLLAASPALQPRTSTDLPAAEGVPLLQLAGLVKDFPLPGRGSVRAVDDVTLDVPRGRTVGLVGESGSGKTTTLRMALGLETPTAGVVSFDGEVISGRGWRELRPLRRRFGLVHQNPFASLDPRYTVQRTITEPLVTFRVGDRASRAARARELLDQVALPVTVLGARPAELSGGQRQRVAIARALALAPELLLLDEPVSALDVSVQAQILDLLVELQRELGLSYLFVSHDLAVVAQVCATVAVMRAGRIVESGSAAQVFDDPQHDYTRELVAAIPGRRAVVDPAVPR